MIELALLLGGSFLMVLLVGARPGARRRAVQDGAARVRAELEAVYAADHEIVAAKPADFPEVDVGFYEAAGAALERRGFRRLADLEDRTVTRAYPSQRTFLRVFVDEGALVRAAVSHFRPRGVMVGLLQLVRVVPRDVRIVELVTEASSGHVLVTANTAGLDRLDSPRGHEVERLPPETPVDAVAARHATRLATWLRAHAGRVPVPLESLDDVLASWRRHLQALARYRAAVGGLSREELERIKGSPLTPLDEEFLAELAARGGPASGPAGATPR